MPCGYLEPFVVGESFTEYLRRMDQYFILHDVPETRKVAALLAMCGPKLFKIATKVFFPEDPCQQSFEALTKKLSQNLEPDSNVATERYKFHRCVQAHDQSMTDYIIQLEACSWTCQYEPTFKQEALCDQFVCGVYSNQLRAELLREPTLNFGIACYVALSWESAVRGAPKESEI